MHVRSVEKLRPDMLKRNEKTHINEKQHQCDIKVRQVIPSQFDLKHHEEQVHERRAAQREYQCSMCYENFLRKSIIDSRTC